MKLSELDYSLPPELIAQRPLERRDDSRLLVYERVSGAVRHRRFAELPEELGRDELVVVNDTRVVPARIRIERPRGEVLLLERLGSEGGEGLGRPTRRPAAGGGGGPGGADAPRAGRGAVRDGRAARAPRCRRVAAAPARRACGRGAGAAVH